MEDLQITEPKKPTMGQRIAHAALYTIMGVAILIALLLFYWLVQSPNVLEVKNSPFPVRPPVVAQQDAVIVHLDYCKHADVTGTITAKLVGKRSIITLPWSRDNQDPGCVERDVPILIPEYAANDVYHLQLEVVYQINPIKTQKITMRSEEFTVQSR